jgi:hypothetical protein
MKAEATVLDELVDDVTLLVDWLKKDAQRGSAGRELLHGLMRDLWVAQQASQQDDEGDDAAFVEPFMDAAIAKLELASRLFPAAQKRIKETAAACSTASRPRRAPSCSAPASRRR